MRGCRGMGVVNSTKLKKKVVRKNAPDKMFPPATKNRQAKK